MVKINKINIEQNSLFIKKIQCNEFSKHFSVINYFIKSIKLVLHSLPACIVYLERGSIWKQKHNKRIE